MSDELEGRFASFAGVPTPALPGAAAAAARGAQRRRRTRAALSGAGVLVVGLAVTAGVALGGAGGERLDQLPVASAAPAVEEGLTQSLLDAEDVAALRGDTWEQRATDDFPFDPLPGGCGDPVDVFGEPAATALRFLDGPDRYLVGHSLKGYADGTQAQEALERVLTAISRCGESQPGYQLQQGIAGSRPETTYATGVDGNETVVIAIERIGAVLSGVAIRSFELDDAAPLADAARAEVSGGPFDAPEPPDGDPGTDWDAGQALLTPEAAATVEEGKWTSEQVADPERFAPCGRSPDQEGLLQSAAARLQVLREAGGTSVLHQVYRYSPDAGGDVAEYGRLIEQCPSEPARDGSGGTTSYRIVTATSSDLFVRVETTCETCAPYPYYVALVNVDDGVGVLTVQVGEDGDPGVELTQRYGELARRLLRAAQGTTPPR